MWSWDHLKEVKCSYWKHMWTALHMGATMAIAAAALFVHAVIPWWQQPRSLRVEAIRESLQKSLDSRSSE